MASRASGLGVFLRLATLKGADATLGGMSFSQLSEAATARAANVSNETKAAGPGIRPKRHQLGRAGF